MSFRSFALLVFAVMLLAVAPVRAQACGPFFVTTTVTGPGCAPFGGGIPTLTAGLGLSPSGVCNIPFTMQAPFMSFPPQTTAILGLGFGNPALNLGVIGWPTCTLWTSLDATVAMAPAGSGNLTFVSTLSVPQDPALVGTSVLGQALMIRPALGLIQLGLSNGLSVSL